MPFPTKIQPIDCKRELAFALAKPVAKSRLMRLLERQFLRSSSAEKAVCCGEGKDHADDAVSLDAMIVGYLEERNHEKSPRGCCSCFHANFDGSNDDDDCDTSGSAVYGDAVETIKSLVHCASVAERNLLADASRILEKAGNSNSKVDCRAGLASGLRSLGYDAATCKSRWDQNPSFTAGEHEYVDVVIVHDRLLVDADFRSEFEVARPSKTYRAFLQHLPQVFVGRPDRLLQIVAVASEAARQSLKKKGLHVPPWRRHEYMRTKWFSPYQRASAVEVAGAETNSRDGIDIPCSIPAVSFPRIADESCGEEVRPAANESAGSPWMTDPATPTPMPGNKCPTGLALIL